VAAGWPSNVAADHGIRPPPTFSLGFPFIASWRVSARSQPVRCCKVGPASQRVWLTGYPLGPLVSGLSTLPPHVRYTPGVTLILVEF
jgi:hypothetical protein